MESLCRLGIGLALCLVWVICGTPAQADAISESPFTLDPPSGWQRDIIEVGTARFVDHKNQNCSAFITPHASDIGPEIDEPWLRSVFNIERNTVITQLSALGAVFLNEIDQPALERLAYRTYAIHGSFLMKAIETGEQKTGNIQNIITT